MGVTKQDNAFFQETSMHVIDNAIKELMITILERICVFTNFLWNIFQIYLVFVVFSFYKNNLKEADER